MIRRKYLVLLVAILLFPGSQMVFSQKSEIYTYPGKDFRKGIELYEKEKYGAAKHFFEKSLGEIGESKSEVKAEAQYYLAMSSVELQNLDAEYLVFKFVEENPESPLVNRAWYRLANYMYIKKNWPKTISYYNNVDRFFLDREELSEYYFQKGYAYYMRHDYENARVAFYEIKDIDTKYSPPALYYYSHIAYVQENYETALQGFLKLVDDETFSPVAPYYISQIYYLQKKFEKVIEFAPPLMETVSKKRAAEMAKIIGESYFYLGRYEASIPYLEQYRDAVDRISIEDKYQLAYAYYMTGHYLEASQIFERISLNDSEISQSALYHLAGCYIRLGEKNKARAAFASAARMDYDQDIKEDALFNYAKVTYELSYTPFNEAIRAFNTYISLYPASSRIDEAYNYLVMAYMNTRNYRMALESLEKIKDKNSEIEKAYQRVAFFRGLELFTNLRFNDAITILDKALKYDKYDATIKVRTYYWLAEAYFRMGDPGTAEDFYQLFLDEPVSVQTPEFRNVNYSMGYLEFSRKNYAKAESWFRKYVNLEQNSNSVTLADSYNRLGDCRFVQSSYWQAIEYYDNVIKLGKADVDYAYYQKAFTLGLVDRPQRKIETLSELLVKYPQSAYDDDALYELGRTYLILNDPKDARENYATIVANYPSSNYLSRALVQLGLISRNAGSNNDALKYYKRVVNDYPGSTEASSALKSIKNIYVDQNDVDGYLAFVKEIGQGVSVSEQDSLLYAAAENTYLDGECEAAVRDLDTYLQRFPNGAFLLNANYYRADCLLKLNKADDAFSSLEYIVDQPANMFTEPALVAASRIAFNRGDYNRAAGLYKKLVTLGENKSNINEAEVGLMRSYAKLNEYQNTIDAANQVLLQDKLEPSVAREAKYLVAHAYFKQNDTPAAYDWYSRIDDEVNSEQGAEAKYRTAEIDYNRGNADKAEKEIFEFIDMNTPHQYWMGKAFLLLSEIYLSKNDDFQAVQTLESIINYYTTEDDGIKAEAIKRKNEITNRVDKENAPVAPDSLISEPDSLF
ncbi:MAG TPA: tetratricopeptide repeat protein [Bacteroidales bacterium]|nr:tetratricopeptide repeat protein [Bacteroidales bacterium]